MDVKDTARNILCNAIADALDYGRMEFQTSADALIVAVSFNATAAAFTEAAAGVCSATELLDTVSTATNTIEQIALYASSDTLMLDDDCNTTSNFWVSNTSISAGETMRVNSFTITIPAS
jgi:hypothetical protein